MIQLNNTYQNKQNFCMNNNINYIYIYIGYTTILKIYLVHQLLVAIILLL